MGDGVGLENKLFRLKWLRLFTLEMQNKIVELHRSIKSSHHKQFDASLLYKNKPKETRHSQCGNKSMDSLLPTVSNSTFLSKPACVLT